MNRVSPNFEKIINDKMRELEIDEHQLADVCDCSYQTIRNAQQGKNLSARLALAIIEALKIDKDPKLLGSFLLSYLESLFPDDEGTRLIDKSDF